MKKILPSWLALALAAPALFAESPVDLQQVLRVIQELRESQKQLKETVAGQQKTIDKQQQTIETLQKQVGDAAEKEKIKQQIEASLGAPAKAATAAPPVEQKPPWSPSQPIPVMRSGSAYMNISFDALMDVGWSSERDPSAQLQLGDHDPTSRGFSLRNAEISLDGAVDPYFKGFANIVTKLDNNNSTEIELEEAYLLTTSLPHNFQFKAGQFFANFGRQNPQHPHQWTFVDQPLILNRAFGPDGLRNVGAQVSWLTPLPFYTETFLGVFNGQGSTAFSFRNRGDDDAMGTPRYAGRATLDRELRGPQDLLFVPRIASSFDLSDTQTLVAGLSGAFGPNDTGPHNRTEIYGVDLFWKWKPTTAQAGFPFVTWQTEALYRRFDAGQNVPVGLPPEVLPGPSAETLRDWGFYSQVSWGFVERWVASLRGEFVAGNNGAEDSSDIFRGDRTRISPALTFYPSEFSKFRLQYNHDHGEHFGDEDSVWLQMEFLLGAHGAHKF